MYETTLTKTDPDKPDGEVEKNSERRENEEKVFFFFSGGLTGGGEYWRKSVKWKVGEKGEEIVWRM